MRYFLYYLLFGLGALLPALLSAQAPASFNYQAVVRDGQGDLIVNEPVEVVITLRAGGPNGAVAYAETHNINTNAYGLINLQIGQGVPNQAGQDLESVDWGQDDHFLNIRFARDGQPEVDLGTTQLLSVPYALYAASGNPGPQGPQGPQGPAGNDGADGADGIGVDTTEIINDSLFVTLTNGQVLNAGFVRGQQGPAGPQGPQGPQGAPGVPGAQGPAGPQGSQGAPGPVGPQGPQGPAGPTGPRGLQGVQGPKGADGTPGAQGPQGLQGIGVDTAEVSNDSLFITLTDGAQLNAGFVTGEQGPVGPQGPQGPQGVAGPAGPAGLQGIGVDTAEVVMNNLQITLTDGSVIDAGNIVGPQGAPGTQGPAGADGVGVDTAEVVNDTLEIELTDGSRFQVGPVPGALNLTGGAGIQAIGAAGDVEFRLGGAVDTVTKLRLDSLTTFEVNTDGRLQLIGATGEETFFTNEGKWAIGSDSLQQDYLMTIRSNEKGAIHLRHRMSSLAPDTSHTAVYLNPMFLNTNGSNVFGQFVSMNNVDVTNTDNLSVATLSQNRFGSNTGTGVSGEAYYQGINTDNTNVANLPNAAGIYGTAAPFGNNSLALNAFGLSSLVTAQQQGINTGVGTWTSGADLRNIGVNAIVMADSTEYQGFISGIPNLNAAFLGYNADTSATDYNLYLGGAAKSYIQGPVSVGEGADSLGPDSYKLYLRNRNGQLLHGINQVTVPGDTNFSNVYFNARYTNVDNNNTGAASDVNGLFVSLNNTDAANVDNISHATLSQARFGGNTGIGVTGQAFYQGNNTDTTNLLTLPNASGVYGDANIRSGGLAVNAYGFSTIMRGSQLGANTGLAAWVDNAAARNIGANLAVRADSASYLAFLQNLGNPFNAALVTLNNQNSSNDYNLYIAGQAKSYVEGQVGIGVAEPNEAYKLDIEGDQGLRILNRPQASAWQTDSVYVLNYINNRVVNNPGGDVTGLFLSMDNDDVTPNPADGDLTIGILAQNRFSGQTGSGISGQGIYDGANTNTNLAVMPTTIGLSGQAGVVTNTTATNAVGMGAGAISPQAGANTGIIGQAADADLRNVGVSGLAGDSASVAAALAGGVPFPNTAPNALNIALHGLNTNTGDNNYNLYMQGDAQNYLQGQVGLGSAFVPEDRLHVGGGNLYLDNENSVNGDGATEPGNKGSRIILKNANGDCFEIYFDNTGALQSGATTCPEDY